MKGLNTILNLIPVNNYSRPGIKLKQITGIVVHWTGNAGTQARQNLIYLKKLALQNPNDDIVDRYASCHFIVDAFEIIQCIPLNEMAYHCGAYEYKPNIQEKIGMYPNAHTIGVETCHPDNEGQFTPATIERLIQLVAKLLIQFNLRIYNVYRHYDVTGKFCPKYYVKNKEIWNDLLNLIKIKKSFYERIYNI